MRRPPADRALAALVAAGACRSPTPVRRRRRPHGSAAFHAAGAGRRRRAVRTSLRGGVGSRTWTACGAMSRAAAWRRRTATVLRGLRPDVHRRAARGRCCARGSHRGHARDGHGDLRADHCRMCSTRALPALADAPSVLGGRRGRGLASSLSPELRAVDAAADVSFLVMELVGTRARAVSRAGPGRRAHAAALRAIRLVPALDPVPRVAIARSCAEGRGAGGRRRGARSTAPERERAAARARRGLALAGRFAFESGAAIRS